MTRRPTLPPAVLSAGTVRLLALLIGLAAGCSAPEPVVEYAPYSGPPAYPDRRPKLPAGSFAYVGNRGSDSITVLDPRTLQIVAEVPIGRDPVSIDAPVGLAVEATGVVFATLAFPFPSPLPGPHARHASPLRWGYVQRLAADDLRRIGEVQIPPNAARMALRDTTIAVTHLELARALDPRLPPDEQRGPLSILDASTLSVRQVSVCRAPNGVAFGPDARTVFVACQADDAVAVLDTRANGPRAMLPLGCKAPTALEASPSGKLLSVACGAPRETRLVDTQAEVVAAAGFAVEGTPFAPAWSGDEARIWIPTQTPDALLAFDVATRTVSRRRAFDAASCLRPGHASLAPDGATLYVVCEGDHVGPGQVLALDPATLETRSARPVGV